MAKRVETLETAQELADRVASVLDPGEVADLEPVDQVPVPAPLKLEAMKMDGLYMSITQVNRFMPEMVNDLLTTFFKGTKLIDREYDPVTGEVREEERWVPCGPKEKKGIFETLAKFSLTDKRLEKEFGLLREAASANGGSISLTGLNIMQLRQTPGAFDRALKEIAGPGTVGDEDGDPS